MDVLVLRDGRALAREQAAPERRRNQYSVAKSFVSAAVGLAIDEGLLSLDDSVSELLGPALPRPTPPRLTRLRVRHLLSMTVGQGKPCLMAEEREALEDRDWVSYCLTYPFDSGPGEVFTYSNAGPYLAGRIVQERAGCNLVDYLEPRLFAPLGIERPRWETDPEGFTFGSSGLYLTVDELVRFGQLYLQGGEWEGRQLIPKAWVRDSTTAQVSTGRSKADRSEYGFCFWLGRQGSFRAEGKFGQYCLVLPQKGAVIGINAQEEHFTRLLDLLWVHLYPFL